VARRHLSAALALVVALAAAGCGRGQGSGAALGADRFDSGTAFALIERQVALGQRPAGSAASRELAAQLRAELPNGAFERVPGGLRNVVGSIPGSAPAIVIAAHYDTEYHPPGFVGANDGAAGTAAVIELSRALAGELGGRHREVRFVLFDGEEEPPSCTGPKPFLGCMLRGSHAYAKAHSGEIGEAIVLDYIANKGLVIPRELNSDAALWARLRSAAAAVGAAGRFPGGDFQEGIVDDQVPFVIAKVPAIDLIDYSYRYADTVDDTPDKLDPAALDAVGETVAELALTLAREKSRQAPNRTGPAGD
jgi:Zn-dependent M28 family amino/carboxypeptidase